MIKENKTFYKENGFSVSGVASSDRKTIKVKNHFIHRFTAEGVSAVNKGVNILTSFDSRDLKIVENQLL